MRPGNESFSRRTRTYRALRRANADVKRRHPTDRRLQRSRRRGDEVRNGTAPAARGGDAADVGTERDGGRRATGVRRDEDRRAGGRDAGIDRASELPDERDVDVAVAAFGVEPADDVAAWARELIFDTRPWHAGRRRNGDPGSRYVDADLEAAALVRGVRGRRTAGRDGRRECGGQQQPRHGILRNQRAESAPPTISSAPEPPANTSVNSRCCRSSPRREPSFV